MSRNYKESLNQLEEKGLLRGLVPYPAAGGKFLYQGKTILNFSSNDYLNLSSDPRLKTSSFEAMRSLGCSATASRLMSGDLALHEELEKRLAGFTGREAALLFGSGFLTNLGVLTALAGRNDAIFTDRLSHASLIDGARLSGAAFVRYRHNDMNHLEDLLKEHKTEHPVIVTDSIFSMDGDIAPIEELAELADRYDALLVIDEAHAVGVFGLRGGGVCCQRACRRPDVIVGTLSKALGGYGGFAAGSQDLRQFFINRSRSFIYSTGLPPACLGSAMGALNILETSEDLGNELLERADFFRTALSQAGFNTGPSCCQIIPIMVGDNTQTIAFSKKLRQQGIIAVAVRPPTVPPETARMRLSVTLAHEKDDLADAADVISTAARDLGIL